ncbi:hypothetical protein F5887DRAFT_915972 [Amanita rubescens]|nr:hypothetical protein F5887DRAFT_915972 [Amanita rubescens]
MHFSSLLLTLTAATAASAFYYPTFLNLNGATEASDYLTYTLVPTIYDCFLKCNAVAGCNFVNTYHDVNGKVGCVSFFGLSGRVLTGSQQNGSPDLTCSMYKTCHYSNTAINKGGQTQPSGLLDYITESDGWCKY